MLISFEGIDGTGKTTLIRQILDAWDQDDGYMTDMNWEDIGTYEHHFWYRLVEFLKDRSEEPMGWNGYSKITKAFLFLALHAPVGNFLGNERCTLVDRYTDSVMAYQGYGDGVDLALLSQMCSAVTEGRPPKLTILLDIDPKIALRRKPINGSEEYLHEHLEFLTRVRNGYLQIAKENPHRFFIVDAAHPKKDVFALVYQRIKDEHGR